MDQAALSGAVVPDDSNTSGVSWGAIVAGAFVAAALSLVLLALGAGIGLSAISPWANVGASASAIGWTAIIWLVLNAAHCLVHGRLSGWTAAHTVGQGPHA